MKKIGTFVVCLAIPALSLASQSLGSTKSLSTFLGSYGEPTQTFIVGYETMEACEGDKGEWMDDLCIFPSMNEVNITQENGQLMLDISTVGSSAHSCSYTGKAVQISQNTLVSKAKVEHFDGKKFVPAVCEIKVKLSDKNSVSVQTNGKCQEFCGMRATLEVGKARRK